MFLYNVGVLEGFGSFRCNTKDLGFPVVFPLQEGFKMGLTVEGTVFSLDPLEGRC